MGKEWQDCEKYQVYFRTLLKDFLKKGKILNQKINALMFTVKKKD